MLSEIELEALKCFDRPALEGLQMHSRYLRDLVNRHARILPLRYIHDVKIKFGDVYIRQIENDNAIVVVAPDEQDLEAVFHRFSNAFIRRLTLDFVLEDLPLPYYLRANANDLQCEISVLRVGATSGIDYALADFLGLHLKPETFEVWSDNELSDDTALLFKRDAYRGNIKHVVYELEEGPAPVCIIPGLFGEDAVETCAISTEVDPQPWIRKFIEIFKMAERGTNIVRTVTLLHTLEDDDPPLHIDVELLGQPKRSDAPTPHSAFVKEWARKQHRFGDTTAEATVAKLYVFENAKLGKKLEIFVWTVQVVDDDEDISLHYAFLLQVGDV